MLPQALGILHFITICEFKLELQSGNAQFGSKSAIFCPVWSWNLTDDLENNKVPLLSYFKLCASFHNHWWIQTGVTVWQPQNWDKICFCLCDIDLWPLTLTFCMNITFVNGNNSLRCHDDTMRVTFWKRCHRRTGWRTDGQTDISGRRAASLQLKKNNNQIFQLYSAILENLPHHV